MSRFFFNKKIDGLLFGKQKVLVSCAVKCMGKEIIHLSIFKCKFKKTSVEFYKLAAIGAMDIMCYLLSIFYA